ncbi:transposase [Orientia tsutsugamushi str. Gilliam]|uniref:Transposase n=2 Tax=Orientia tsutsugamushi str. Gilliam TaxID=1359184 RepID=A0A2U3QTE4_ORITS|nr:transposase [Orientia tsutsugamushi str. Gilliam]
MTSDTALKIKNGLRIFTNISKYTKTYLLDIDDKRLLNKPSLIESVFNILKNICI